MSNPSHVHVGKQHRSSDFTRLLILQKKTQFLSRNNVSSDILKNDGSYLKLCNPSELMLQMNLQLASFSNVDTTENSTTDRLRYGHQLTKSVVSQLEN